MEVRTDACSLVVRGAVAVQHVARRHQVSQFQCGEPALRVPPAYVGVEYRQEYRQRQVYLGLQGAVPIYNTTLRYDALAIRVIRKVQIALGSLNQDSGGVASSGLHAVH